MAAVVKCDACGKCVEHKQATHIRTYKMSSATSYCASDVKTVADVCPECNAKICKLLGKAVK